MFGCYRTLVRFASPRVFAEGPRDGLFKRWTGFWIERREVSFGEIPANVGEDACFPTGSFPYHFFLSSRKHGLVVTTLCVGKSEMSGSLKKKKEITQKKKKQFYPKKISNLPKKNK